ncbi:hypothetical protein PybrP1_001920 [[Pythium] brassicae (nom. inval.)]|nr:hypothetical protein PybrP1_001920 [[Pythium] brassicae (nom. inval.)]
MLKVHLSPPAQPVVAVDQRWCACGFLTLRVEMPLVRSGIFYQDVVTQSDHFVVKGKLLSSKTDGPELFQIYAIYRSGTGTEGLDGVREIILRADQSGD